MSWELFNLPEGQGAKCCECGKLISVGFVSESSIERIEIANPGRPDKPILKYIIDVYRVCNECADKLGITQEWRKEKGI